MFNAYVLHYILYRETSLIVKFFTKEHGIVNLVAHGAKRKKSQIGTILQPFVPLLIYWKNLSLDLATLHKVEATGAPHRLSGICLFGSLYINELLLKLLATHDPHAELFNVYQRFLENLSNINKSSTDQTDQLLTENKQNKIFLEKNLRFIEKQILKTIGYELQLDRESQTGDAIDHNAQYDFDFEDGLILQKLSSFKETNNVTKAKISGKSLLALHNDNFTNAIEMQEAKLFMRKIIANFLGDQLLATRKLFV